MKDNSFKNIRKISKPRHLPRSSPTSKRKKQNGIMNMREISPRENESEGISLE